MDTITQTARTLDGSAAEATNDVSRRTDIVTMILGAWLLIGLFVDGWAHSNLDGLETFFTPWHALFYSGFGATAAWIGWVVIRRQEQGMRGRRAIPRGYDLAILGLVIFGVGGAGDMAWHSIFGIETGVDALFSPTHLLLFAGILLVLSTPLRRSWERSGVTWSGLRAFGPTLASLTLVVAAVMFMMMFLSPFTNDVSPEWIGQVGDGFGREIYPILVSAIVLTTNAVLLLAVLVPARRWVLPRGTITVLWSTVAVFSAGLDEFAELTALVATVAVAVVADVVVGRVQRRGSADATVLDRRMTWTLGLTLPVLLWTTYYAIAASTVGIGLQAEMWTGNIMWAALTGGLLALAIAPPATASLQEKSSTV